MKIHSGHFRINRVCNAPATVLVAKDMLVCMRVRLMSQYYDTSDQILVC